MSGPIGPTSQTNAKAWSKRCLESKPRNGVQLYLNHNSVPQRFAHLYGQSLKRMSSERSRTRNRWILTLTALAILLSMMNPNRPRQSIRSVVLQKHHGNRHHNFLRLPLNLGLLSGLTLWMQLLEKAARMPTVKTNLTEQLGVDSLIGLTKEVMITWSLPNLPSNPPRNPLFHPLFHLL